MTGAFLPYGRQSIDEADVAAVAAVLRGDFLTQGPVVEAFEAALAARTGAAHAVACSNGTAALHLACLALGLEAGDAVVVPANTFLATASAARLTGAEVAFADVDPETGLMGVEHAVAAIARARAAGWRVRALAPVHFAGQCADMERLGALAEEEGLAVIEDACHALGAEQRHGGTAVPVGGCARSSMAVFSFHPVKTVAAGEGGAVTTNDGALAARLRLFRNHGMVRDPAEFIDREAGFSAGGAVNPWYYEMPEPGFNYRLTDIQSALALSSDGPARRFRRPAPAPDASLRGAAGPACPAGAPAGAGGLVQPGVASLRRVDRLRRRRGRAGGGDDGAASARRRHPSPLHPGASPTLLARALRRPYPFRRRRLLRAGAVAAAVPGDGRRGC